MVKCKKCYNVNELLVLMLLGPITMVGGPELIPVSRLVGGLNWGHTLGVGRDKGVQKESSQEMTRFTKTSQSQSTH